MNSKGFCLTVALLLCVTGVLFLPNCKLQDRGGAPVAEAESTQTSPDTAGPRCGEILETFNGVHVRYNPGLNSCGTGRHRSSSGYSYGLRWQCVEFVRRYYAQALGHEMPEMWGDARDYFNKAVPHGGLNRKWDLVQFKNGGTEKPKVGDLLVFPEWVERYGHVSIVAEVSSGEITAIQQNLEAGPRTVHTLVRKGSRWTIGDGCAGFLRVAR